MLNVLIHQYGGNAALTNDSCLHFSILSMQGRTFPQILNLATGNTPLFIPMSIAMAMKKALKIATRMCTQILIAHEAV